MAYRKEGIATGDWTLSDGWIYSTKMGIYGTNYLWRALVTLIAIGANLAEDASTRSRHSAARISTSCTLTRATFRRSRDSGR